MKALIKAKEASSGKVPAGASSDARMQLGDFNRPRRRFVLGAWLSALGQGLRSGWEVITSGMNRQGHANQSSYGD